MVGIGRYTYLLCIQYFACLIFVGNGRRRKIFNGKNFPIYGSIIVNAVATFAPLVDMECILVSSPTCRKKLHFHSVVMKMWSTYTEMRRVKDLCSTPRIRDMFFTGIEIWTKFIT